MNGEIRQTSTTAGRVIDGAMTNVGKRAGGPADPRGLDYGAAPAGITRFFRGWPTAFAGLRSRSSSQDASGHAAVIPHPVVPQLNRGIGAVGGALAPGNSFGSGSQRLPSVFVPSSLRNENRG